MSNWHKFEGMRPSATDTRIWLGNVKEVHPDPVIPHSPEYQTILSYSIHSHWWTHWRYVETPKPPCADARDIACRAFSEACALGISHEQLIDAIRGVR